MGSPLGGNSRWIRQKTQRTGGETHWGSQAARQPPVRTGPIISAIIATAVNNEIMRLTEATSFREGGARQPRHVAQRGCSMTGWELGAWLK